MLTRHELAYAAWYSLLFTMVVGWAALRPAPHFILPVSIMPVDRVAAPLDGGGQEPEKPNAARRILR